MQTTNMHRHLINKSDNLRDNEKFNLVLSTLQDYMLNDILINRYSHKTVSSDKKITINDVPKEKFNKNKAIQSTEKKALDRFSPFEKDKLFWCFFVLYNGYEEYEFAKKSSFKTEKDFKITSVEKMKDPEVKAKLKECKIKLTEIQDELVNQPLIDVKGLYSLCLLYNINLLYVKNRVFYDLNGGDGDYKVIVNDNNNIYIPDIINEEVITNYRNSYWKIENIAKPLNAFSSYSLKELQDICIRMNIETMVNEKKLLKKELYESILSKL